MEQPEGPAQILAKASSKIEDLPISIANHPVVQEHLRQGGTIRITVREVVIRPQTTKESSNGTEQ